MKMVLIPHEKLLNNEWNHTPNYSYSNFKCSLYTQIDIRSLLAYFT